MLSAVGRVIVVVFAVMASAGVAIIIAFRLGLEHVTNQLRGDDTGMITVVGWLWQGLNMPLFLTLVMALGVIVVGEVAKIRSALFYIAGGGLALAAAPVLSLLQNAAGSINSGAGDWPNQISQGLPSQVFATSGFAAGAVYWLIAGRKA